MTLPSLEATTNLGPANYQARVQAAARAGGVVYAATFRQSPPHLVGYDPGTERVVETHEIPMDDDTDSPGAWNLVALDDRYLFTVLHEPTQLLRFDRETAAFDRLAEFPQTEEYLRCCRAIKPAGDTVVFALKVDPVLYEWDQAGEELREFDRVHRRRSRPSTWPPPGTGCTSAGEPMHTSPEWIERRERCTTPCRARWRRKRSSSRSHSPATGG